MSPSNTAPMLAIEQSLDSAPPPPKKKAFVAFQHRNYQLWFSGQLVSVIGTWMQAIARGWLLYELSRSEFTLGLMGFFTAVPVLLLSPWGGVLIDFAPKRAMLVITQTMAMLLAFVLALLTFTGRVQVWHILLLSAFSGVVNAFDAPARQAFVVEMVGREDMQNAITLNSMLMNMARIVGPALGGLLLVKLGSAWCFLLNGISFVAVIAGLLAMQVQSPMASTRLQKPLQQFVEGVRYARQRTNLRDVLVLSFYFSVFGLAYSQLLPAFVDKQLNAQADGYGAINTMIGVGAVTATLVLAYLGSNRYRGRLLAIANFAFPFVLVLFAFNQSYPLALSVAVLLGLGFMLQINSMNVLLQTEVDDQMRGRVMSLFTLVVFGLSPLGSLTAGWLAEQIPLNLTITLTALVMLVGVSWVHLRNPEIRHL